LALGGASGFHALVAVSLAAGCAGAVVHKAARSGRRCARSYSITSIWLEKQMKIKALIAVLVWVAGSVAHAQVPVTPASDQLALLKSTNPALARNKRLVFDFWREVLEAGQMDAAPKYLAVDYLQHNPNVATGLQGFISYFSKIAKPREVRPTIQKPLISVVAEGDFVVLGWVKSNPIDPSDATHTYTTTSFDMFRVKSGHIVEHWDTATLQVPPPR
jgi:predicted SnoaL-like aldol condensation-catalyzing enzyme